MTELKSLKQVIEEKPNYYGKKANKRRSTNEPWHDLKKTKEGNIHIFACILLTSYHMIFLMQFGINQHS